MTDEPIPSENPVHPDAEERPWLPDPPPSYRFMKRAIDIFLSALALVVFSPVFLIIAIAIKLTSRGPLLFRQTRLGYHAQPFKFLKFRSMYLSSDPVMEQRYVKNLIAGDFGAMGAQPTFKIKQDPRITPIGRFLRRTSLDELPQFINVLRGDMSLVGPRPPIPYEVGIYREWQRQRLSCKPGITGVWQISGRSRTTFDEMVKMDLDYIKRQSIFLDLWILLQTPRATLKGEGAF